MTRPAQTLAEKLCARAAGLKSVEAGKIVTVSVDLAMIHDSGGPRRVAPMLEELGVSVWNPDRIVLVSDHYVPAVDSGTAEILNFTRKWARENGVTAFHDMQGICHVVLPERGHLKPGLFVVGGDSHSTTGGAFGAFMIGIGATEMAGVLATGEIWIKVPPTVRLEWRGALGPGVVAKDMMLAMCAALGMDVGNYKAIEFGGSAVDALDMEARMTLSNMAAELGGKVGLVAPDENTVEWLSAHGVAVESDWLRWRSDDDSLLEARHVFDADVLMPQVAAPHSPANADDVLSFRGTMFHQAYIGACTGAKLTDLHMAAEVLRGRTISDDVRLLVAPASTRTTAAAAADGTLAILTDAGAIMMPSGCGACAGYGAGVLAEGEVCLSSTARNFKGRMGHPASQVYLASPYTVAASAVTGEITDPREFLLEMAA